MEIPSRRELASRSRTQAGALGDLDNLLKTRDILKTSCVATSDGLQPSSDGLQPKSKEHLKHCSTNFGRSLFLVNLLPLWSGRCGATSFRLRLQCIGSPKGTTCA